MWERLNRPSPDTPGENRVPRFKKTLKKAFAFCYISSNRGVPKNQGTRHSFWRGPVAWGGGLQETERLGFA